MKYEFDPKDIDNVYSIDTPPPTVSGHLHMGHVFSYCHADFIARFQRMSGKNVFYPMGFDDNGLPTERLVEKITGIRVGAKYNDKSKEILLELMGKNYDGVCTKSDFIEICRVIVKDAELEFEKLFKSIDLSVNWDYKYQSISDNSAKIAQTTFINLWEKGLIYNKHAPVYWCCQDKTATANTEIEEKEMPGVQIEFKWKTECGIDLTVMTTRPEMLPACRALLFNPEDDRFNGKKTGQKVVIKLADASEIESIGMDLNGKTAIVPIFVNKVPILPDHEVKMDKGTGLVMCCTYGDWQDVIWAKRHNLGERIIISEDGKICHGPEVTDFLKVEDTRKKAIELLENAGLVVSKKEIKHAVKCAERSGKPLEIIPAKQWYLKTMPFKAILLEMSKLVKFHPEYMRIKLENWINGISQDWCISRNRFSGIPIPMMWSIYLQGFVTQDEALVIKNDLREENAIKTETNEYTNKKARYYEAQNYDINEIYPDKNFIEYLINKYPKFKKDIQDRIAKTSISTVHSTRPSDLVEINMVLDTWFTSGLSPHLATMLSENINQNGEIDLKNNKIRSKTGEIMSLRPQAHEIIRTWTFVTLVQSYLNLATELTDEKADFDISDSENYPTLECNKEYIVVKTECGNLKCHKPQISHLPWANVMLSGWCLASDKTKMSKSKGNIVTPVPLIEEHGSDSVRYWSGSSTLGADTAYNEASLKDAKRLITKLKNAAKLCLQTIEKSQIANKSHDEIIEIATNLTNDIDRAILVKISDISNKYSEYMQSYEYSKALDVLEKFFWVDFCDNYLELSKVRSYGIEAQIYQDKTLSEQEKNEILLNQSSVATTMYFTLTKILTLFAPFLTQVTEEIYINSILNKTNLNSIHQRNSINIIPSIDFNDKDILINQWLATVEILDAIRKKKSDGNVSLKTPVNNITIPEKMNNIFPNGINKFNALSDILNAGVVMVNEIKIHQTEILITLFS